MSERSQVWTYALQQKNVLLNHLIGAGATAGTDRLISSRCSCTALRV
jgi:hypothetical protein